MSCHIFLPSLFDSVLNLVGLFCNFLSGPLTLIWTFYIKSFSFLMLPLLQPHKHLFLFIAKMFFFLTNCFLLLLRLLHLQISTMNTTTLPFGQTSLFSTATIIFLSTEDPPSMPCSSLVSFGSTAFKVTFPRWWSSKQTTATILAPILTRKAGLNFWWTFAFFFYPFLVRLEWVLRGNRFKLMGISNEYI